MLNNAFAQRKRFAMEAMARKHPELAQELAPPMVPHGQPSIPTLFQQQFQAGVSEMDIESTVQPASPSTSPLPPGQNGQQKLERYFGSDAMGD
jgi:hypothetical protein